jgi:hypothetical protein
MNYGAHLAHQKKSRLLSGESSGNVEHTLQFQHSKDDPSHGVKITNVGYNHAEKCRRLLDASVLQRLSK